LFAEDIALLGEVRGQSVLHLQCNAGQDTLSIAQLGATVTGVDWSDHAIAFARQLSMDSGIAATFVEHDAPSYVSERAQPNSFDVVFFSYGVLGWIHDLNAYVAGMARVLKPGGRLVGIEIHPLVWCIDQHGHHFDSYETSKTYDDGVSDYVTASLAPSGYVDIADPFVNPHPALSWQHTSAQIITAVLRSGLRLQSYQEYPYANGFRPWPTLVARPGNRWGFADDKPNLPLMHAIVATKS
jgi:SAM-dependent methyltransferase